MKGDFGLTTGGASKNMKYMKTIKSNETRDWSPPVKYEVEFLSTALASVETAFVSRTIVIFVTNITKSNEMMRATIK